ncbi:hypothetical protein Tco_0005501 [Tanacetum coccineum]
MDDPNMTMEEYIKLEEEKACRCGRVFNWQTATYGKIRVDDDLHDLRYVEAIPAIVIDDAFTPQDALSCKSQVSTLVNDKIDFRISFDESNDKDYTIICDKNSFSYKMIYVNNLKTDLENDNEKAGIPSFPPSKPMTSYINDLDFFKDFENEFPVIVYNDAQTSKSNLLTLPILSPQHIDEFNLNDETSVSEYDEEEQNILYFNDLFPFNIIRLDDLKMEKDNNDNDIYIIQSLEDMAPLPPREQRHPFLKYQDLKYTDANIADFEERLERIYGREINKVQVVDFQGMPELMRDGLLGRIRMEHRDDAGVVVFTSRAWGRFLSTLRFGEVLLDLDALSTIQFQLGGARRRLSWRQFILALGLHIEEEMESPSFARDPVLRLFHRMMVHSIARRSQAPEKSGAHISGGQFVSRLAEHFGLLTAKILGGLMVITPELPIINMGELVILQICMEVDDTWAWAPQQPPPPPLTAARTMPQRLGRLEEEVQGLRRDVGNLYGLVERLMTDHGRFSTWMMSRMAQLMDASRLTYQAFDGTF